MEALAAQLGSDTPLSDVTVLVDGSGIFAAKSPTEVYDVLQKGQGVFGIAVGPLRQELEADVAELFPADVADVVTLPERRAEAH